jgi:methylmalonyl-CoA/ethylmalonyl-CoA epimerase
MIGKIHHINYLVKDLNEAVGRYERLFGLKVARRDRLGERGVETARFRLGEAWIVLVQPIDPDSVPGRHLAEKGEGFFLVSYEVDDLLAAAARVKETGARLLNEIPRQGLDGWRVIDIHPNDTNGVQTQLVETATT